jgi:endonuclease/exonuclease/phosphatase family metal-dependent hydrolase
LQLSHMPEADQFRDQNGRGHGRHLRDGSTLVHVEERRWPGLLAPASLGSRQAELRVASYNLHKCVGTDGKFDPGRVAAVIAELGADIVALQEADRRFGRRTGLLDIAMIEQRTGLVPLPISSLSDGLGWHGNALLVRPGTAWRFQRLVLPGAEPRGAVIAELVPSASTSPLRVVAAHLGLFRRCRTRQVDAVLKALAQGPDFPTLLLGDLNEWRVGRARSALRGFESLFGPVDGGPPSFPSRRPLLALDRILGCPRVRVSMVEAHDSPLARVASDHLPLKAWVRLEAAAGLQIDGTLAEAA